MQTLPKPRLVPLLLLSAALLLMIVRPAAAAKFDTPWTAKGSGTVNVAGDGVSADPKLEYSATDIVNGSWDFGVTAASTRSVPVKWSLVGSHTSRVEIVRYVLRNGTYVVRKSLAVKGAGAFDLSGTTTFDVQQGDSYGFRVYGVSIDAFDTMRASLTLHEVDSTPPVITSTVTGKVGIDGWYVGPTTVTWNVRDDESRISSRSSGCDPTDLPDTLYNLVFCSATSAGGTATVGFPYMKDTTAPVITTPAIVTAQGLRRVSTVPVTYSASATDNFDPNPSLSCLPASGSRFAIGTTTVTCTAKDHVGNTSSKQFSVKVYPPSA
jgi:hypothetical protein